jgi:hypothetical protein
MVFVVACSNTSPSATSLVLLTLNTTLVMLPVW